MNVDKHTPAPWRVVKCSCGHSGCRRYGLNVGMFPQGAGFDLSDATLAASAPDLLALARQYAAECAECNGHGEIVINAGPSHDAQFETRQCPDCADIRAVIAKAVGPC